MKNRKGKEKGQKVIKKKKYATWEKNLLSP